MNPPPTNMYPTHITNVTEFSPKTLLRPSYFFPHPTEHGSLKRADQEINQMLFTIHLQCDMQFLYISGHPLLLF